MLKRFIGDRAFYRRVLQIALPIVIQNGITNFVSLLDNIMIGQVGTVQMNGAAISNLLLFVFNLCVFGAVSGAGIFTAQFHGAGNAEGVRRTFRFKLLIGLLLTAAGTALFLNCGDTLISLFLKGQGSPEDAAQSLRHGREYLQVMLLGLLPFALANAYSSTLRETGQTLVPMVAGACAVVVNLCLNYVLIFGHFGAPVMGVRGAALATAVSRFVELAIVAIWTHLHSGSNPFIVGAYRSAHIGGSLLKQILIKGTPLLLNEALWSTGMTAMNQCFSLRSLDVVGAMNISTTLGNLGSVVFLSLGNVVGILMGQELGSQLPEKQIREDNAKLTFTSIASCLVFSLLMMAVSGLFPRIYDTTDSVRQLATRFILIYASFMPLHAFLNAAYFTLRSGGQTGITFLFDSGFVWVVSVPLAYFLVHFTSLPILPLYAICLGADLLKCGVGVAMLRSNRWIKNLTNT